MSRGGGRFTGINGPVIDGHLPASTAGRCGRCGREDHRPKSMEPQQDLSGHRTGLLDLRPGTIRETEAGLRTGRPGWPEPSPRLEVDRSDGPADRLG